MPLYEYRCRECGDRFEVLQRMGEGADGLTCRGCGAGALEKQFSTFATAAASGAAAAETCGAMNCGAGACCGGGACGFDPVN